MTTYRLMDGLSGRPGNGPASVSAYSGNFTAMMMWKVTSNGLWLNGYYHWVPANGDTVARKFALWQLSDTTHGVAQTLVLGSVVTSGTMTQGTWNFVPLATPLALSASVPYAVSVGWVATAGFPDTQNQFGSGNPYAAGITNGPLFAYSDQGASAPEPFTSNYFQGSFSTATADPSAALPITPDIHSNFWVDVQVSDQPPAGSSVRLWPNQPTVINWTNDTATNFTIGTEFSLSQPATLNKIWFYSQPGVTQLPTACGIWRTSNQTLVASNLSPTWSGAAGSGWISCSFSSTTLTGDQYKVTVFNGAASPAIWNASTTTYWASPGPGQSGITDGILSAPNNAGATAPGQSSYHQGTSFTFPDTNVGPFNYWVDVEITPIPSDLSSGGLVLPKLLPHGVAGAQNFASGGVFLPSMRLQGGSIPASGGIALPKMRLSGLQSTFPLSNRTLVHQGIASYIGGTWVEDIRAYQDGPLFPYGVGTVRAGWGKHVDMQDFFDNGPTGRSMGCYIIVEIGDDQELKRAIAGAPTTNAQGIIVTGGIRLIQYPIVLHCFHVAQVGYSEDAQADIDLIVEQIKYLLRVDPRLGMPGTITDGGVNRSGIRVHVGRPGIDENDRTGTYFTIRFDVRAQIIS